MPDPEQPPAAAGHDAYVVAERIAIGHAGVVFRATQRSTGLSVLFKVLSPQATHPLDTAALPGLKKTLETLRHPCIAAWLDAYDDPDGFVLVHEYLPGAGGNVFPTQRKLTAAEIRFLARRIIGALVAGEKAGIPHGDIKPSNLVISDNATQGLSLQVLDWGLSTCRANHPVESLLCMAPERLEGGPPSIQADLFATGATITFLATGCFPTHGADAKQILAVWRQFDPASITKARPDLDEHFCKWLAWLMRLTPHDRPDSAEKAREVLDHVIAYATHKEKQAAETEAPRAAAAATKPPAPPATQPASAAPGKPTASPPGKSPAPSGPAGPSATTAPAGTPAQRPGPGAPPKRTTRVVKLPTAATAGATTTGPQKSPRPGEPVTRRTLGAKIVTAIFVLCAILLAFVGVFWWAESRHGAGWLGERWKSLWRSTPKKSQVVFPSSQPAFPEPAAAPEPAPDPQAQRTAATRPAAAKPGGAAPRANAGRSAASRRATPPGLAREKFDYPDSPKLDGATGGTGWAGPWKAAHVNLGESEDRKFTFALLGGAAESSARRAIAPFAQVEKRGLMVVFTVWHPGADGPVLVSDALAADGGKLPAPLVITPGNENVGITLEGSSDTMSGPVQKGFRIALRWDFKPQADRTYEVEVRAWTQPDSSAPDPLAKAPSARVVLKNFSPPPTLALALGTRGSAKRAATITEIRVAQTVQDALK